MTKNPYDKFKDLYLSEKAFREHWGNYYEDLVERRDRLLEWANSKDQDSIMAVAGKIYTKKFDEQIELLTSIFISLEKFRVKK